MTKRRKIITSLIPSLVISMFIVLSKASKYNNTAWYLINQGVHKLYHDTRQEKRLEMDTNIRNKVVTFTVDARWADHSREWKGTWASKGDGNNYSS